MTTPSRSTRPQVLFVGDDASSLEIAAGLMRQEVGDGVGVGTACTQPGDSEGRSDEMLVAMGLNPADEQRLSSRALHTADRVIILGDDLDIARLPGPQYEEWDLTHGDLIDRVESLSQDLTAVPEPKPRVAVLGRVRALLTFLARH